MGRVLIIGAGGVATVAAHKGEPVILSEQSNAGQAYEDAVARLLGEEPEERAHDHSPVMNGRVSVYLYPSIWTNSGSTVSTVLVATVCHVEP